MPARNRVLVGDESPKSVVPSSKRSSAAHSLDAERDRGQTPITVAAARSRLSPFYPAKSRLDRRLVRLDCVLGTQFESSQPHHAVAV